MAKGKARKAKLEYIQDGRKYILFWPYWLSAHALIHGGAVWLITGNMSLGLIEVILHWIIDFAKCEGWTNIHIDQLLHMICKAVYVWLITSGIMEHISILRF